ncbi:MAG TPA: ABC transporter permease [Candidatus Limnocylindria bacterium]|jgi:NitT/TauT family transport system permease protein
MTAAAPVLARPARRSSFAGRLASDVAPPLIALALALALWEGAVAVFSIPFYLLPAPSAIVSTLWQLLSAGFVPPTYVGAPAQGILYDAYITLLEAMVGLVIGTAVGLIFAVIMTQSRFAEQALYPIVITIRSTPTIAIAPIFIIWFGFTIMPKAIVAALATFYPVLVNSITGMRSVEPTTLEFFQSVHASRWEVFWHLRVPNTLPYFFTALRLNVSLSLIGAIVGELVGARDGVGHMITAAAVTLRTTEVFSGVVVLTAIGLVLTEVVSFVQSRVLFWHETERA